MAPIRLPGIVVQAAEDYREALRKLKINPVNGEALRMKKECDRLLKEDTK